MPSPNNMNRFKSLIMAMLGQQAPQTQAQAAPAMMPPMTPPATGPQVLPVQSYMDQRQAALNQMGGQNMGGMFDIIYRKKLEKENALRELGL